MGIICFCLAFGTVLGSLGDRGGNVLNMFKIFEEVIMQMVVCVMFVSPIGIASIIASKILGKCCGLVLGIPKCICSS